MILQFGPESRAKASFCVVFADIGKKTDNSCDAAKKLLSQLWAVDKRPPTQEGFLQQVDDPLPLIIRAGSPPPHFKHANLLCYGPSSSSSHLLQQTLTLETLHPASAQVTFIFM